MARENNDHKLHQEHDQCDQLMSKIQIRFTVEASSLIPCYTESYFVHRPLLVIFC